MSVSALGATRARSKRTCVARNIYRDAYGFSIVLTRDGVRSPEHRFALDTPLATLIQERTRIIDALEEEGTDEPGDGLAGDVARCLATLPPGRHKDNVWQLLRHWLDAPVRVADGTITTFGALPRADITVLQVRTQIATFRAATRKSGKPRFAPKTIKELRRLLAWVYTTLDGVEAKNPVRAVKVPPVRYNDPRGLDYEIIEFIFAHIPDRGRPQDGPEGGSNRGTRRRPTVNLSKLRMRVMAYTGMHQIEVGRLEPQEVDLAGRRVWIGPRQKGAGTEGEWHELTQKGVEALTAFAAADAYGPFDTRSMSRTWRRGLEKAKAAWEADPARRGVPWPVRADARPYDLRHSVGTAVYKAKGDIRAAQAILRHKQLSTTVRYTHAGVNERVRQARIALDEAWAMLPNAASTDAVKADQNRAPLINGTAPAGHADAPSASSKNVNVGGE